MMTKEEYQRNIVRMFDSLRTEYKGKRNCDGIECNNCPFNGKVCNVGKLLFSSFEAIEIVENWAKENPIQTNAEKFREVFGTKPSLYTCVNDINCEDCKYYGDVCYVRELFWDVEYNEKTKE